MKYVKLKWAVNGDTVISYATEGVLESESLTALLKEFTSKPIRNYLVTVAGPGEMSSVQRKQVAEVFNRRKVRVAVVTDETISRYIVTAISWLGVDIKAFPWKGLRDAIRHLGAFGPREERFVQIVQELKSAAHKEG